MIDEPVPTMPEMVPATSPTKRTKRKLKGFVSVKEPHPEERRVRRVSKDERSALASWFETAQGRLLTMRAVAEPLALATESFNPSHRHSGMRNLAQARNP